MLDQYVEGELDEDTAKSLIAHMTTCGACAGAHRALRREQEIYASYLVEVEPPPALWARLSLQLEKEKAVASQPQVRLPRWLACALESLHVRPQVATALVLIIIGLAIGIMVWRTTINSPRHQVENWGGAGLQPSPEGKREVVTRGSDNSNHRNSTDDNGGKILPSSLASTDTRSGTPVSAAGGPGKPKLGRLPAALTVDEVALSVERQYLSAIEILSRDIKRSGALISPALHSQLETALAEMDRNIAATRKVAHEQPRDPVAIQYLSEAYEKKVELLREVTNR